MEGFCLQKKKKKKKQMGANKEIMQVYNKKKSRWQLLFLSKKKESCKNIYLFFLNKEFIKLRVQCF